MTDQNYFSREEFANGRVELYDYPNKCLKLIRIKRLNIFTKEEVEKYKSLFIHTMTPEQYIAQVMFNGDMNKVNDLLLNDKATIEKVLPSSDSPMPDEINRTGPQIVICIVYGCDIPYIAFVSCSNKFVANKKFLKYGLKTRANCTFTFSYNMFKAFCENVSVLDLYENTYVNHKKMINKGISRNIIDYIGGSPVYEYNLTVPVFLKQYITAVISYEEKKKPVINLKTIFPKDFYSLIAMNDGMDLINKYCDIVDKYSDKKNIKLIKAKLYVYNNMIIHIKYQVNATINLRDIIGNMVSDVIDKA